jgi:hypothetical protein
MISERKNRFAIFCLYPPYLKAETRVEFCWLFSTCYWVFMRQCVTYPL